jgi:hypothetical protein
MPADRPSLTKRDFTRTGLTRLGFQGWVKFADLAAGNYRQIPERAHGIYVVLRSGKAMPRYVRKSPAGTFRGDPSKPANFLTDNWVERAAVVYIGKADLRRNKPHALRTRLKEFTVFGSGGELRHWGGRLIWQLSDSADLLVAWMPTPGEVAADVERWLIAEFRRCYGKPPFANNPDRRGA